MSLDHPHHLIAATIAVAMVLVALWMQGGLAAALLGAALTDLGLSIIERRRSKAHSTVEIQREDS